MSAAEWGSPLGDVELRLFGPMQLGPDQQPAVLGGQKQRAVLAALALQLGHAVSADALIELLWSVGPRPSQPRRTLQVYVANLRKLLRRHTLDIAAAEHGYRLVAGRGSLDSTLFEDLVAEAVAVTGENPVGALALHERANELWRGRALDGLVDDFADLDDAARRLDDMHRTASELRLGLAVRHGDPDRAVEELLRIVDAEPWREHAVASLMIGYYLQGRQVDALAVARTHAARMVDELGLVPSPLVRATEQDVLEHRIEIPARAGGPPRWQARTRLPTVASSFVGRRADLGRLSEATSRSRLVTVVGAGGVGKTRLVIEAAQRMEVATFFVPLVSVDAAGVIVAALDALDLSAATVSAGLLAELLAAQLRDRPAWIVLDNAEHVLDEASVLASALVRGAPTVTVVVTSRAPLAVPGEVIVDLVPLGADDARELFAERAELVDERPDLADPLVRERVDQLCAAVDGLPLAIELAANRVRVLPLPDMVERLADRFALVHGTIRSNVSPHATMLDTIAWSYERLDAQEQAVLQRLAMFPAGATAAAAEAVCWLPGDSFAAEDVVDLLAALVDQSLVIADHSATRTRFRLLETIRQFADGHGRRAPWADAADAALWTWAAQLAVDGERALDGSGQLEWVHRFGDDLDNIRAGFERAIAHGDVAALRIASGISYLRANNGELRVAATWLRDALATPVAAGGHGVERAIATIYLAWLRSSDEGVRTPRAEIDAALDIVRRHGTEHELLNALATAALPPILADGDLAWGMPLAEEVLARAPGAGAWWSYALAASLAALGHLRRGHLDEADALAAGAADRLLAAGNDLGALLPMRAVWLLSLRRGDVARLRHAATRAAQIERRYNIGLHTPLGRFWLAALATMQGDQAALDEIDAALGQPGVPLVRFGFQALRSMVLRRAGNAVQARAELVAAQPIVLPSVGAMAVLGLVERGWCELALDNLDAADESFRAAAATAANADDAGLRPSTLEGRAAIALLRGDVAAATTLLAEASEVRSTAPALLQIHDLEASDLRARLAETIRSEAPN